MRRVVNNFVAEPGPTVSFFFLFSPRRRAYKIWITRPTTRFCSIFSPAVHESEESRRGASLFPIVNKRQSFYSPFLNRDTTFGYAPRGFCTTHSPIPCALFLSHPFCRLTGRSTALSWRDVKTRQRTLRSCFVVLSRESARATHAANDKRKGLLDICASTISFPLSFALPPRKIRVIRYERFLL